MPSCPQCGVDNPDGFRFCGHCGVLLSRVGCPACGNPYSQGQRFCGGCGAALDEASGVGQAVAERKLATVLFADVVGFTSLAERTDPEVVARMIDAAFRELSAIVVDHGGTIDKYMGDSLMAVFGVPTAHDDDAERAVAAALAMRKLGGDLVFSIGINSGEVMVTSMAGEGGLTVIGDTVNVAARLEKAAGPGEVLCGPLTVELVGPRGVFRARQPVVLKGKLQPVGVWEAVALGGPRGEATADVIPLVGRDEELAYLVSLWQRVVREEHFQVVLLCGEAGSGKTRLAAELGRLAGADGTVVRAAHPAYGSFGGVAVVSDVLAQLGPVGDGDVAARVMSLVGKTDETLRAMDPEGLKKEQLWGLIKLFEAKASLSPLLIVVDDVHRSSPFMLDLVGEMAGRLSAVPLLMLLAGRTEPGSWLTHFPSATTVRLGPLPRADAACLARAMVCDKVLDDEAAELLAARAAGNPLHLRELVRMAEVSGSLVEDGGRYGLGAAAASLPASLHAVLAARLDSLGAVNKLVFQHVAVLGGSATEEAVGAMGAPRASDGLRSLAEGGLLRLDHEGVFEAADPLLREVAYETLPRNVRGELHKRAAGLARDAEERARHFERAAEYLDGGSAEAEAAAALATLGEEYLRSARYSEAVRALKRASDLGCRQPEILLRLADLEGNSGDGTAALSTLELIADDPAAPEVSAERDHTAARVLMFSAPDDALARLIEVAARWRSLGRPDREAWALANAGVAHFNLDQMDEAASNLERALATFERLGDRAGEVACSSFLCLVKPADRRVGRWLSDALAFADKTGERSRQVTALSPLAWHHFLRSMWGGADETAQAEGFAARLASVGEELGMDEMVLHGRSLLAIMYRWTGRVGEAGEQHASMAAALGRRGRRDSWLAWAAGFAVAVAEGASSAAPPFPPPEVADPVAAIASIVVRAELAFAGRIDEAARRLESGSGPSGGRRHGPVADAAAVLDALTLVLAGRGGEAALLAERAASAGRALGAAPTVRMAEALTAEIGEGGGPPPVGDARSVAGLVALRTVARRGDAAAMAALRDGATALSMPGLAAGVAPTQ